MMVRFYTAKIAPRSGVVEVDAGHRLGPRSVTISVGEELTAAELRRIFKELFRLAMLDTDLARRRI